MYVSPYPYPGMLCQLLRNDSLKLSTGVRKQNGTWAGSWCFTVEITEAFTYETEWMANSIEPDQTPRPVVSD